MNVQTINEILQLSTVDGRTPTYGIESKKLILQGLLLLNESELKTDRELLQILISHFNTKEPA